MARRSAVPAVDSAFTHLACRSCSETYDGSLTDFPCPNCRGILDPQYDYGAVAATPEEWASRSGSMWKYHELLPVTEREAVVTMGEGATPLVDCPRLADRIGVGSLAVKDEGQNPTNTFKDRGQAAAISRATQQGADTVALSSAGNAGQSASAYAARAGIDCHVFLNHQAGAVKKQLVRAHGATLHLSEGKKTMGYELFEAFGWESPDHVVYPTGGGVGLIGIWKAYRELSELGWVEDGSPALHVAQTTGAAPVVEAIEAGADEHTPWEDPDSVARGVEIPDPGASPWMLEAVSESGGTGVAVSDEDAVEAALTMARRGGPEMCVTSAVAFAGAMALAADGVFGPEESVVVLNTGAGCKTPGKLGAAARDAR